MLPEIEENFRQRILTQLHHYYRSKIAHYQPYSYLTQDIPNALDLSDEAYLWWLLETKNAPQQDSAEIKTSLKHLEQIVGEHSALFVDKDLVDIGCGNGAKSIALHELLQKKSSAESGENKIYFIDNANWLRIAEEAGKKKHIQYEPKTCNFYQDTFFDQYDDSRKIYLLLGNTFSNFRRGRQVQNLIRHLNSQMKTGESLLVELTLQPQEYYEQGKQFLLDYLLAFDKGLPLSLQSFYISDPPEGTKIEGYDFWDLDEKREFQMCFKLEENYFPPPDCPLPEDYIFSRDSPLRPEKRGIPKGTTFIAAHSQRYTSSTELIRLFKRTGFGIVPIQGKKVYAADSRYQYILLRKEKDTSDSSLLRSMAPWFIFSLSLAAGMTLERKSGETNTPCQVWNETEKIIKCSSEYGEIKISTSDIFLPQIKATPPGTLIIKTSSGRGYELLFGCYNQDPLYFERLACHQSEPLKNHPEHSE